MSLLSEAMENCIYINRAKVSDGYGGYMDVFVEGVQFKAAITFDTSIEPQYEGYFDNLHPMGNYQTLL